MKRPRGSLSPLQKKRARVGQKVNETDDEAGEKDDGMGDEDSEEEGAVAGLEQRFKQLATGHAHTAQELI